MIMFNPMRYVSDCGLWVLKSFIHLFSDYRHDSLDNVSIRRSQAFTTRNNQYQVIDYGFEGGIIGKKYILLHASRNFFPIGIVNIGYTNGCL